MLTWWANSHPVKFKLPIAQNCPPSKLPCPQKMGTTIIENKQFKPKLFAKFTKPEGETPQHPRIGNTSVLS